MTNPIIADRLARNLAWQKSGGADLSSKLAKEAAAHLDLSVAALANRKLCVKEAAAYLGLSVSTLNKLRLSGDGPPYLKLGRRVLYDIWDLEAWVAERKRNHTSEQS